MATTIKIRQKNTAPPIIVTCTRSDGSVINLTNCTVKLILAFGSTIVNAGHQDATVTDAVNGKISYVPEVTDFANVGSYKGDVEVTYGDATDEVLYDQLQVKVKARLQP